MRVYIAGPMSGLPEFNFPAFHDAAERWRVHGHDAVNPAELDDGDTTKPYGYYIKRDLLLLLDCEAIAMLPGWRNSRGANLELLVAEALGLPVYDAETMEELR